MRRCELRRVLGALRRSRRVVSVRVLELLALLYERECAGASTLALERMLGKAGTRRVLSEALRGRAVPLVRRQDDVWVLTEDGVRLMEEFLRRCGC